MNSLKRRLGSEAILRGEGRVTQSPRDGSCHEQGRASPALDASSHGLVAQRPKADALDVLKV